MHAVRAVALTFACFLAACPPGDTDDTDDTDDTEVGTGSAVIGPDGGTVRGAPGPVGDVRVTIPPGALSEEVTVTISEGAGDIAGGGDPISPHIELGPAGTGFALPVEVETPYVQDQLDSVADVVIAHQDAEGDVVYHRPIYIRESRLVFETTGFSGFQALDSAALEYLAQQNDVDWGPLRRYVGYHESKVPFAWPSLIAPLEPTMLYGWIRPVPEECVAYEAAVPGSPRLPVTLQALELSQGDSPSADFEVSISPGPLDTTEYRIDCRVDGRIYTAWVTVHVERVPPGPNGVEVTTFLAVPAGDFTLFPVNLEGDAAQCGLSAFPWDTNGGSVAPTDGVAVRTGQVVTSAESITVQCVNTPGDRTAQAAVDARHPHITSFTAEFASEDQKSVEFVWSTAGTNHCAINPDVESSVSASHLAYGTEISYFDTPQTGPYVLVCEGGPGGVDVAFAEASPTGASLAPELRAVGWRQNYDGTTYDFGYNVAGASWCTVNGGEPGTPSGSVWGAAAGTYTLVCGAPGADMITETFTVGE